MHTAFCESYSHQSIWQKSTHIHTSTYMWKGYKQFIHIQWNAAKVNEVSCIKGSIIEAMYGCSAVNLKPEIKYFWL